jgi:uncharacterized protein (DUF1684 family)
MKNTTILFCFFCSYTFGQLMPSEIETKRQEHIKELSDTAKGILNSEEVERLGEINYFAYDQNYVITGTFIKSVGKKFKMPTSTDRTPIYRRYGYVDFIHKSDTVRLEVYQNMALRKQEQYKNYLFIPFKDATSAKETYGGGRYIDLQIPNNAKMILDFNTAYNPYCAYSYRYSCPIPPKVNHITIDIKAGEKTPTAH